LEEVLPRPSNQAGNFLILIYDGEHMLTLTVVNESMSHRHYTPVPLANATVSSCSDDK
jgi:hypothetical protein